MVYVVLLLSKPRSVRLEKLVILFLMYFPLITRLVGTITIFVFLVVGMMLDLSCMIDGYYDMVLCGFWVLWKLSFLFVLLMFYGVLLILFP